MVPVSPADAADLARLIAGNTAHLQTFMPKVTGLGTLAQAQAYLQSVAGSRQDGQLFEWHIMADDQLCGAVRINHIEQENRKASIGYYLGKEHQGQGLATLAVRAVLQFGFERMGLNRVELRCASDNMASQRVAKRLGFAWEGLLRQAELIDGTYLDHFVYGLLRADFNPGAVAPLKQAA